MEVRDISEEIAENNIDEKNDIDKNTIELSRALQSSPESPLSPLKLQQTKCVMLMKVILEIRVIEKEKIVIRFSLKIN